ncbi:hypothetical protein HDU76_005930 [Blyttiomyces sp. JEL0837]|nr:hypothetical protein HDU76_005930 [Blyttiomyces sp. JEL0837]
MKFTTLVGLAAMMATSASAVKFVGFNTPEQKIPNAYFIELPAGTNFEATIDAHLKAKGISYTIRTSIDSPYLTGGSVQFDGPADVFADLKAAISVYPVVNRNRITPLSVPASPDAAPVEQIHTLTGVNAARAAGYTGKGIKVAVLDTGIYYNHPALGGGFGPGYKVAYGYDLVGNAYTGANIPVPDSDPIDDCSSESHGTHVAGIVGANALNVVSSDPAYKPPVAFTGVAPDVTLGAYRVFGCSGSSGNDVITQAILLAAKDGSNVINLSLGGGPVFEDSIDAVAATRVGADGHIVVAANGNDGSAGTFVASSPGIASGGLGIASFDNLAVPVNPIIVNGKPYPVNFGTANGNFSDHQLLDIVINNPNAAAQNIANDGCTPALINPAVKGKTAFIRWGAGCGSRGRCNSAYAAGAAACLLYSDSVADDGITIFGGDKIPSAFIKSDAGLAILNSATKPVVEVIKSYQVNFPLATGGTVSSFSSPGLDAELFIKPDLGGIGGQVLSTISPVAAADQGLTSNYGVYSGTSMATPYVAGCIALLLQSNPALTFELARAYLQNYAKPAVIFGTNATDSVARQGAGLINVFDSINAKTLITPSALALNDTANAKQHWTIAITNNYKKDVTYTLSSFAAAQANPFVAGDDAIQLQTATKYTDGAATITFNGKTALTTTVKVGAGKSAQVNVHVAAPATADPTLFPVYSGYVKVANDVDESVATVPYAGVVGNWKDAPVLAKNSPSYGASAVGVSGTGLYIDAAELVPEGYTYNATAALAGEASTLFMIPIAASTSRQLTIEAVYTGSDAKVVHQLDLLGLAHKQSQGIVNAPYYIDPTNCNAQACPLAAYGPAIFNPLQRTASAKAQSVVLPYYIAFDGGVLTANGTAVKLPPGQYKLRFSALKHFARIGADPRGSNYDIVFSNNFNLVY